MWLTFSNVAIYFMPPPLPLTLLFGNLIVVALYWKFSRHDNNLDVLKTLL